MIKKAALFDIQPDVSAIKPFSFEPMLCERAQRLPEGHWRYELKLDGFRAIGRKSGRGAQLWSRNQKDFTRRFPDVVKGIAELPSNTVIDGEIVALDASGKPSFNLLQGFGGGASAIVLYAFDLLMLRGKDARLWPLEERRKHLREMLPHLPDTIRFSEAFDVPLSELMREVRRHQLEGIVAKRAGSQYRSGERSSDWLKWRANRGQEFVIGGYVPNGNLLDSILAGYYIGRDLMYAASVRAGFSAEFRRVLLPHLEELRTARCPFANLPDRAEGRRGEGLTAAKMATCRRLDPFIVARIEFLNGRLTIDCVTRVSPASAPTRMLPKWFERAIFSSTPTA